MRFKSLQRSPCGGACDRLEQIQQRLQFLLWLPLQHSGPALLAKSEAKITAVRWNPRAYVMAYTTSTGEVTIGALRTQETTHQKLKTEH